MRFLQLHDTSTGRKRYILKHEFNMLNHLFNRNMLQFSFSLIMSSSTQILSINHRKHCILKVDFIIHSPLILEIRYISSLVKVCVLTPRPFKSQKELHSKRCVQYGQSSYNRKQLHFRFSDNCNNRKRYILKHDFNISKPFIIEICYILGSVLSFCSANQTDAMIESATF